MVLIWGRDGHKQWLHGPMATQSHQSGVVCGGGGGVLGGRVDVLNGHYKTCVAVGI